MFESNATVFDRVAGEALSAPFFLITKSFKCGQFSNYSKMHSNLGANVYFLYVVSMTHFQNLEIH